MGRTTASKRGIEDKSIGNRPPLPRQVDVITEDDEDANSPIISPTSGRVLPMNPLSKRADASQFDANSRTRAISTSQIQAGAIQNLTRKYSSLSTKGSLSASQKRSVPGSGPLELSDRPNRTRKVQRDISDMDLDEIMNGSEDEKAESRTVSSSKAPRPAKISKSARDLIDFLDEGPPAELAPPPPPQSQVASSPKSTGRFRRIVSKLTGSSSNEKLREDAAKLRKPGPAGSVLNVSTGATNHPQSPVRRPTVVIATPPPRVQSIPQQVTPPDSPPTVNQDPPRPMQRRTSVRKKVPPVDPELETSGFSPTSPSAPRIVSNEYSRPSALANGNGQLNRVDEAHKPVSPPSSSPEPEPRARPDTIVSDEKIMFRRSTPATPAKITVEIVAPTPTSLPVTIRSPSPPSQHIESSLNATHAQNLRQLMSTATTADECRVLVDMFLARVGFPIDRNTNVDPYPSPISSTDPSDVDLESSVIETLLGGDSSSSPSTPVHSSQPSEAFQADESEVGTSDGDTGDEDVSSSIRHSPSRVVRDSRVNHSFPPPTRLLAVA